MCMLVRFLVFLFTICNWHYFHFDLILYNCLKIISSWEKDIRSIGVMFYCNITSFQISKIQSHFLFYREWTKLVTCELLFFISLLKEQLCFYLVFTNYRIYLNICKKVHQTLGKNDAKCVSCICMFYLTFFLIANVM